MTRMSVRARMVVVVVGLGGILGAGMVAICMLVDRMPFWPSVLYVLSAYAAAALVTAVMWAAIGWAMKGGSRG